MNFTIAGFYTKENIINRLLFLYEKFDHIFKKNIKISSLYDSFPNLKWNGGRVVDEEKIEIGIILNNIQNVNQLGIGINFVFTNFFIKESDFLDTKCNEILEILSENSLNGVIISSPNLQKYISCNYPNLKITLSLTYFYNKNQDVKQELENVVLDKVYNKVVIPPDLNTDYLLLSKLDSSASVEILVNETCYKNCIFKSEHYRLISLDNKYNTNYAKDYCHKKYKDAENDYLLIDKYLDLFNYTKVGINNFKISGRSLDDETYVKFLCEYLVEDKYKDFFHLHMNNKTINNINFESIYAKKLVW